MIPSGFDRRFWLFHALLPSLLLGAGIALFELSEWDLLLSDPFYDAARGGWYLKKNWWLESVLHRGGQNLIFAIGVGLLLVWGWGCWRGKWQDWRRAALFLALCIGLSTGLTGLGKVTIDRHCPWEYDRYGGSIPYVKLFEEIPPGYPAGHGFPAGHASGGFALMGSYFIFHCRNRRLAIAGLLTGVVTGSIFAVAQQLRGAHFASHNLWTILLCWSSALFLYTMVFRGKVFCQTSRPAVRKRANRETLPIGNVPEIF